ncbi:MAG: hypothetical protein GXP25_21370 [Planctomycetes bacterium]|nr:hypothetical protein [Planctomycetota bacterium]
MRQVRVDWDGPFSVDKALSLNHEDNDSGLYQVYGVHTVFGPDSLLYIGMARDQTFGERLRQHELDWLRDEEGLSIRVGRINPEDYAHEPPGWPDWRQLLADIESLEIFWHAPPYNCRGINEYIGQPLRVMNNGEFGGLSPECTSDRPRKRPRA